MKFDRIGRVVLGLGLATAVAFSAPARADVIIPTAANGNELQEADSTPLGINVNDEFPEWRMQMVYGGSLLSAAGLTAGMTVTGLTFRIDTASRDGGPFHDSTLPAQTIQNYEIGMGASNFAPGSLSADFAANRGTGFQIRRSGQLVIGPNDFVGGTPGDGPNPWGVIIAFTPFTYLGGDLLVEIAHDGFPLGGRYVDDSDIDPLTWMSEQIFVEDFDGTTANVDYWGRERQAMALYLQTSGPGGNEINLNAVPAPSALSLFGAALAGMMGVAVGNRRRKLTPARTKS